MYWMWEEEDSGINVHMKLSADALYDWSVNMFPSRAS